MQPLTQRDRYVPLDILRGLALFGVLLVNLLTIFRVSLFAHIAGTDLPDDAAGRIISTITAVFLEFKAFTLFSFLFGAGIAVQMERLSSRGGATVFLLRRFLVLLAIGIVHLVLIWNGDILTLYAVSGLLAIPLLRLPNLAMAIAGVVLIWFSYVGTLPIHFPNMQALQKHALEANSVYAGGSYVEIFAFRWRETKEFMGPLLLLTLPQTLGLNLLGAAAWRSNLLTARRNLWLPTFLVSAAIGAAGSLLHIRLVANVSLAITYAAAVLLWIPKAPLLAAGGQMALTNYLAQSLVFCLIFYGYGLGQFGRLGVVTTTAGGIVFYLAQLIFSRWWLDRFQFGPVEWLWRSLTYERRQPMRKR